MARLPNVIFLISDSLRYDATQDRRDFGLPYTTSHSTHFTQARAAGCWTLPATASMFSGKLPHEHGATSQTRKVHDDPNTLAERFKAKGYRTYMSTANAATTHIFGLDRGFDRVDRIWTRAPKRHTTVDTILASLSKARIRRNLLTKTEDFVMGRMTDDIEAARAWVQSNALQQFQETNDFIDEANRQGDPVFAFVNIMESHFPYHIADTFETYTHNPKEKAREYAALFHLVNQTRLISEKEHIRPDMLEVLRQRQRRAWDRVAPMVDDYVRIRHETHGDFVVFASDHGDLFGEQNWQYHFSNVADAGNRVPLFVLEPDQDEKLRIDHPVSMRDLYGTILRMTDIDHDRDLIDLRTEPQRSVSISESFWYNRDGKTLPRFKFNQFAFLHDGEKYIRRNDRWLTTKIANGKPETDLELLPATFDPFEELKLDKERRAYLAQKYADFSAYSAKVLS